MNFKTIVIVLFASALGHSLIFFVAGEGASLRGGSSSLAERIPVGLGFILALPVLPFTYAIDCLFHPRWAAIYTVLLGTILSATSLSFLIHQIQLRVSTGKL